jgi:hypothetical protein
MRKWSLALIAVGLAILVGMAWAVPSSRLKYAYKMRVLIEARYGDGIDEFKMEDFDGEPMGAICLDVDSSGSVYVYDAITGDIKVYNSQGKYVKTVKALPWIVGQQMLADMGVTPEGDIWLAVEPESLDQRMRIFRISGKDGELTRIPVVFGPDFEMKDGHQFSSSVYLTADVYGDVYLVDGVNLNTMTLVKGGRVLSVAEQSASSRKGEPAKSGYWVTTQKVTSQGVRTRSTTVLAKDGRVASQTLLLPGGFSGMDSQGNIYQQIPSYRAKDGLPRMQVFSLRGELEAEVSLPMIHIDTDAVGKGEGWLLGPDGSFYLLVGRFDSVKVYKWERLPPEVKP